jgi:hypothetical protein
VDNSPGAFGDTQVEVGAIIQKVGLVTFLGLAGEALLVLEPVDPTTARGSLSLLCPVG